MRVGVSNLLWERDLDRDAARLLQRRGIDAIDIAPTRYFDRIAEATGEDWRAIRRFWRLAGRVACIEALTPPESTPLQAIEQSLNVAQQYYGWRQQNQIAGGYRWT